MGANPQNIAFVAYLVIGILGFAIGVQVGKYRKDRELEKLEGKLILSTTQFEECRKQYLSLIASLQKKLEGKAKNGKCANS
jgi:hypothetical protein